MKTENFISSNFALQSEFAQQLYHDYVADLPIIDYHNHLSPKEIAEDKPIKNISEAWLSGDHYKWRAMRANGVDEVFITGKDTPNKEKFAHWAATVPYTLRNPLFHWTQLELKRYFGIDEILQPSTSDAIYKKANEILAGKTPAQLLEDFKVEVICTTDDPTDDLAYHKEIAVKGFYTKVLPTFRPDALLLINQNSFLGYIDKLSTCVNHPINNMDSLFQAIQSRVDFFDEMGCRLSDYGVEQLYVVDFTLEEADSIFKTRLNGTIVTDAQAEVFASCVLQALCKMYHAKGWAQQFHLGAIRNNNSRLLNEIGLDAGVDSIVDIPMAKKMSTLFDKLNATNQLTKTITYNLNPSQNEVFATMMGNFQNADFPGKMQWGSGWWFLDQMDGIEKQLNCLSNMGLLSRFIGMLTDSRSFLSFPRHEYFRRILCNLIGEDVEKGLLPKDIAFLGKMVQDISYYNAKKYFGF